MAHAERDGDARMSARTIAPSVLITAAMPALVLLFLSACASASGQPASSQPVSSQPVQSVDLGAYVGEWVRSTEVQNFIVYLSITPNMQRLSVRAWGNCKRKPEDGGTRADCEYWGNAETGLTGSGPARLFQPLRRERWELSLSDNGRLWVRVPDSQTEWTRDPGVVLVRQPVAPQSGMKSRAIPNVMGRCLDVAGGVNDNGTSVQIFECNGTAAQRWTFTNGGELRNAMGRCLDVAGGVNANGTNVQIFDCNGTAAQRWALTNRGEIRNAMGRCLDVAGGVNANGTNVQIFDCNRTAAQRWK